MASQGPPQEASAIRDSRSIVERVEPVKSEGDRRKYRCVMLCNGLSCVLVSDPETDKAAVSIDVRVGKYEDPVEVPGLAHFCEHMLFLGTEKYTKENSYKEFLNAHGGRSNASTGNEHTSYYLDVLHPYLNFFKKPLFTPSATGREISAVHNEHMKNKLKDSRKIGQVAWCEEDMVTKGLANNDHPITRFGSGNRDTLETRPKERKVDVRKHLLEFFDKYYTADRMCLAILGRESLDELERLVAAWFSSVRTTPQQQRQDKEEKEDEEEAEKKKEKEEEEKVHYSRSSLEILRRQRRMREGVPTAYTPDRLGKLLRIIPTKRVRKINVLWPIPPHRELYKSKPWEALHLIGDEGKGSILSALKKLGLATKLSTSRYILTDDFCLFKTSISVTEKGFKEYKKVLRILFDYIHILKKTPQPVFERLMKENRNGSMQIQLKKIGFRFLEPTKPYGYCHDLSRRLHYFAPEDVLTGPYQQDVPDFSLVAKEYIANVASPRNAIIELINNEQELNPSIVSTEPFYSTKFTCEDIDTELLLCLERKSEGGGGGGGIAAATTKGGDGNGAGQKREVEDEKEKKDLKSDSLDYYHLAVPEPNVYIAKTLSMKKPESKLESSEEQIEASPSLSFSALSKSFLYSAKTAAEDDDSPSLSSPIYLAPPHHLTSNTSTTRRIIEAAWYKQDLKFRKPKLIVSLRIKSPILAHSPRALIAWRLYIRLVKDSLTEELYPAARAGLYFSISASRQGVTIHVLGSFDEKLPLVLESVLNRVVRCDIEEERFRNAKDAMARNLSDFKVKTPQFYANYVKDRCTLNTCQWSNKSKIEALSTITSPRHLSEVVARTFNASYAVLLFAHGNVTRSEVQAMCGQVEESFANNNTAAKSNQVEDLSRRMMKLQKGCIDGAAAEGASVYRMEGNREIKRHSRILHPDRFGDVGFIFIVTTQQTCVYYEFGVLPTQHEFLESFFSQNLKTMSEETFVQAKKSLIGKYEEKDLRMGQENSRYWGEINTSRYHFNRRLAIVISLRKLTLKDVIGLYEKKILPGSASRAHMSVQIRSQHKKENAEGKQQQQQQPSSPDTTRNLKGDNKKDEVIIHGKADDESPWINLKAMSPLFPERSHIYTSQLRKATL
eukprot:jgi/Bigna1/86381/estExt_fgenesh1_pg.C_100134